MGDQVRSQDDHSGSEIDGCPDRGADDGLSSGPEYSAIIQHHQALVCDQASSIPVASGSSVCQSELLDVDSVRLRNAVSACGEPQGLLVV